LAIDLAELRRIAALAQLELDDAEATELCAQLEAILDHVAVLGQLDVDGVPPTSFAAGADKPLREDEVQPGLSRAEALGNAPDAAAGHFRVPQVLDG
jgi:aspartyl-tRNA(Asn)/glutamyl-tRNA(Gln) amidotransferase subunit C